MRVEKVGETYAAYKLFGINSGKQKVNAWTKYLGLSFDLYQCIWHTRGLSYKGQNYEMKP